MSIEHYLPRGRPFNVCDVFKAAAIDTWQRIKFSRSTVGLKAHETAITQNLVYEMRLLKDRFAHLDYALYESKKEKTNGNDLIFHIRHIDNRIYTYAIQAKIIYHTITTKKKLKLMNGWYTQLKHMIAKGKPEAEPQVDKLLNFAANRGYLPLYLLYNYVGNSRRGTFDESYGCTVVSANYLKANHNDPIDNDLMSTVKFTDLHPSPALPWEKMVCSWPGMEMDELLEEVGLPTDYGLNTTDYDLFNPSDEWVEMSVSGKQIEFGHSISKSNRRSREKTNEKSSGGFNPKYMITINIAQDRLE